MSKTIKNLLKRRILKRPMKILMTEIGSRSSGDEAICVAAASRLIEMGADVTFCYRVSLKEAADMAGLKISHIYMPLDAQFDEADSIDSLVKEFSTKMPGLYKELKELIISHDIVAIAPGGKFTDGLNNPRALLTSTLAILLGRPVIVLHQSVGPIDNPIHRKLLIDVFSQAQLCLIRDDKSFDFLLEEGIPPEKLVRCRDVAMGEDYPRMFKTDYNLGINIRCGFTGHINLDVLCRFISRYKEKYPEDRILIYSTTWDIPENLINRLTSLSCDIQSKMPSYPNYVKDVGRCAINISDSFHGVIFSMMADRPVICCQTDLRTWKLRGIHAPDQKPLTILPGFVNDEEADRIFQAIIDVKSNSANIIERQRRILQYGKALCEEGWKVVGVLLEQVKI